LIGKNLPHLFTNTLKPADGAEAEVLQFSRDFAHGFLDETPEMRPFVRLLDRSRLGIVFRGLGQTGAVDILRELRTGTAFERISVHPQLQ